MNKNTAIVYKECIAEAHTTHPLLELAKDMPSKGVCPVGEIQQVDDLIYKNP